MLVALVEPNASGREIARERLLFLRETGATGGDSSVFRQVHMYDLDPMEQGLSLTCCLFEKADKADDEVDAEKSYVVLGTAQYIPGEVEPSRGRLLLFDISMSEVDECIDADASQDLVYSVHVSCVYEKEVKGAVFSVDVLCGRLVAGIGSKVRINYDDVFAAVLFIIFISLLYRFKFTVGRLNTSEQSYSLNVLIMDLF